MARYRRYRRRPRRFRRRRRFTMPRRRLGTLGRPDGSYKEKVVIYKSFQRQLFAGIHYLFLNVSWYPITAGIPSGFYTAPNDDAEYNQMVSVFSDYKVTGVKIKFIPNKQDNTELNIAPLIIATNLNYDLTNLTAVPIQSTLSQRLDTKEYPFGQDTAIKRFYKAGKNWKGRNLGWLNVT